MLMNLISDPGESDEILSSSNETQRMRNCKLRWAQSQVFRHCTA